MSKRRLGASYPRHTASIFLEIRQDSCEKFPCLAEKSARIRHSANFQTSPKSVRKNIRHTDLKLESPTSSTESGKKYVVKVPPHKAKQIHCDSVYQILSADFYQAKTFVLPCMKFFLEARIEPDCFKCKGSKSHMFRWTIIETKFDCPDRPYKKPETISEGNGTMNATGEFMKPGNGYVLTLGMIDKNLVEDSGK